MNWEALVKELAAELRREWPEPAPALAAHRARYWRSIRTAEWLIAEIEIPDAGQE